MRTSPHPSATARAVEDPAERPVEQATGPVAGPGRDQARTTVVYIGGSGRSGSTLLECMLAELPEVVVLGEVGHLWERGLIGNELCACSEPFHACPFWSEVGERAFGGWHRVDGLRMLELKDLVDRQRRLSQTARRATPRRLRAPLAEYTGHYRRLYAAAAAITGARVVVDSSKVAPTAMALSHEPGIDLRALHIVRDSRGVAFSWQRSVPRPEKGGATMPRLGAARSTEYWLVHNLAAAALTHRGVPVTRIRYEDLVADPARIVGDAWRALDLPGSGELPMSGPLTIELRGTHSVAGNPMRFRTGPTTLRADSAWVDGLPARDRRLVTALSLPLLRRYGYSVSPR